MPVAVEPPASDGTLPTTHLKTQPTDNRTTKRRPWIQAPTMMRVREHVNGTMTSSSEVTRFGDDSALRASAGACQIRRMWRPTLRMSLQNAAARLSKCYAKDSERLARQEITQAYLESISGSKSQWKSMLEAWTLLLRDHVIDLVSARPQLLIEIRNGEGTIDLDQNCMPADVSAEVADRNIRRLAMLLYLDATSAAANMKYAAQKLKRYPRSRFQLLGVGTIWADKSCFVIQLQSDYFDQTLDIPIDILPVDTLSKP